MKLYVPHVGHMEGLQELLADPSKIYSVYMAGSPDYIGTGRTNLSAPTLESIAEQTEYAHEKGVKIDMVLNNSCMGGQQLTPEGISEALRSMTSKYSKNISLSSWKMLP
ncbi:hypothetical protein [Methanohalophilus sp. RSK]|uniref:hypothetical protein n=1 Tax=Methanohalophilus sp. RSK TaxID=2485783 RepID=UPI001F41F0A1|nr:hypothetical protein [Methanohalophilus sp. RSK]